MGMSCQPIAGYEREMFSAGCTMNIGSKKLLREVASTFCGAQAVRINMPGYFFAHAAMAASLGQLGQHEAAQKAVRDLLALRPDFANTVRQEYGKCHSPEDIEHLIDALRKAGLDVPESS